MDVSEQIKEEYRLITAEAEGLIGYYWDKVLEHSHGDQFGLLGVRCKQNGAGLSIEWYNTFYTGPKGKKKAFKKYIPKGKSHSYSHAVLKKHKQRREWEIDLIEMLEPKFAELRERAAALGRVSKSWKYYQRLNEKQSEKK